MAYSPVLRNSLALSLAVQKQKHLHQKTSQNMVAIEMIAIVNVIVVKMVAMVEMVATEQKMTARQRAMQTKIVTTMAMRTSLQIKI